MQLYFYNGQPTTYYITEDAKLFNEKTQKWLKGQVSKNGYLTYNISIEGVKKRLYAHRMLMETYKPHPNSKNLEVNHINGKKLDTTTLSKEISKLKVGDKVKLKVFSKGSEKDVTVTLEEMK